MQEYNYSAILTGALTALGIWACSTVGGFSVVNGWACDAYMRTASKVETSSSILLIEASAGHTKAGDDIWVPVLKRLLNLNPREIVFTFLPEQTSGKFYRLARESKRIVFGRRIERAGFNGTQISLEPLPEALTGINVPYGVVFPGFGQSGIFRQQQTHVAIDGKQWPTLERAAVNLGFKDSRIVPEQPFRVNFTGGADRLPKVSLDRVVSKGLIAELVRDQVLVIGDMNPPEHAWFFTPLSHGNEMMAVAHFHAFALDTLISKRMIDSIGHGGVLLILLFIAASFLIAYQWMSIRMSLWVTILVLCAYSLLTWFFLHFLQLWLPFMEMILAQCVMSYLVIRQRAIKEEALTRKMLMDLSGQLKDKVFPTSFYRSSDPWGPIIVMVNQILNLNRVIFLERVDGDHRLHEIRALNCGVDDIDERRRDYERTPYSTAISEDGPIQVSKHYLKAVDEDEQQFLAPLLYAGDVLCFWAFGIEPEKLREIPDFLTLTKTFSAQISEILHHRRLWRDYHRRQENQLLSYIRFEGGETPSHTLKQSIIKRERWTAEMFGVFNHLSLASILYDLFGRVILVNKQMEEYSVSSNLKPYTMSLLEFIACISGHDATECRRLLRYAIFDQENVTIPIFSSEGEQTHILNLKPLQTHQADSVYATKELEQAHPFRLTGILCELERM